MASTQITKIDNNIDLPISNNQDVRAYIKILERSVRTGRQIQYEKDNNHV